MQLTQAEITLIKNLRDTRQNYIGTDTFILLHYMPMEDSDLIQIMPGKVMNRLALPTTFKQLGHEIKKEVGCRQFLLLADYDCGVFQPIEFLR